MRRLDQDVALVTGGAEGLGRSIAERLASEGATVVISDVQCELGSAAALEGGFTFLEQDVCDEAKWTQVVEEVEKRFGRLNILVNNAGILGPTAAANAEYASLGSWREVFAVNVEGMFLGCRAAIPAMRRAGSGSIVNLSSIADRLANAGQVAYGASKAAVRQLTQSVAQYCAQEKLNVHCNSVHPGPVRTPLVDRIIAESAQRQGVSVDTVIARFKSWIPLGDFIRPEDVAAAVAFLASGDARQITGSALYVDGGIIYCSAHGDES
jgi:3(or 17)beta-hydroxysteroid dehydrogenase